MSNSSSNGIDFSKYYQWDKFETDEYNLKQKQTWTENARSSFAEGSEAYANNKSIDQNPFINHVKRMQNLTGDSGQEANDMLEHSLNPKNTVSKIWSRFRHNLKWWELGWKAAYHNSINNE
ncbi:unnamed protein product [marine sediment metagenome]|uniref:Uncharacterized protein n=1 Tax=marine sediment metagenome TaxID=412755 RepID=X1UIS6_9ZZZZ